MPVRTEHCIPQHHHNTTQLQNRHSPQTLTTGLKHGHKIMKTIILVGLAALAIAAPQSQDLQHQESHQVHHTPAAILEEHHEDNGEGSFNYGYQSENGIVVEVSGEPGDKGQNRVKGMYRFPLPNGTMAEVTYTADEDGFQVDSPLVPPMPKHAEEQILIAREQDKQGIVFE